MLYSSEVFSFFGDSKFRTIWITVGREKTTGVRSFGLCLLLFFTRGPGWLYVGMELDDMRLLLASHFTKVLAN